MPIYTYSFLGLVQQLTNLTAAPSHLIPFSSVQSLSHVRLFATPCRSTPGFPVRHQLPEVLQTLVHCVGDAIQPSYPLSSPSPPAFKLSQNRYFPMSQFFASDDKTIGVSASASILTMNIQD